MLAHADAVGTRVVEDRVVDVPEDRADRHGTQRRFLRGECGGFRSALQADEDNLQVVDLLGGEQVVRATGPPGARSWKGLPTSYRSPRSSRPRFATTSTTNVMKSS